MFKKLKLIKKALKIVDILEDIFIAVEWVANNYDEITDAIPGEKFDDLGDEFVENKLKPALEKIKVFYNTNKRFIK
jgi:hypothetical protein